MRCSKWSCGEATSICVTGMGSCDVEHARAVNGVHLLHMAKPIFLRQFTRLDNAERVNPDIFDSDSDCYTDCIKECLRQLCDRETGAKSIDVFCCQLYMMWHWSLTVAQCGVLGVLIGKTLRFHKFNAFVNIYQ
jgi:hypothetical protein